MGFIFDIGCNVGKWIAANYNENDMFVGVEPHPQVFHQARVRFSGYPNVTILNYAVTDQEGWVDFYPCDAHELSTIDVGWIFHSRFTSYNKWNDPQSVKSITIDFLIANFGVPKEIKIDIEGAEYRAIKGLTKKVGLVMFEYTDEKKDDFLLSIDYLHDLGYNEFTWDGEENYVRRPEKYSDYATFRNDVDAILCAENQRYWGMCYCR